MVGLSTAQAPSAAQGKERGVAGQPDRFVHSREAGGEGAEAFARRREAHAGAARVRRSGGLQADLRRGGGIRQRSFSRCLGRTDRPLAGLAAVRRALGPALDGRGALRRGQPDVGSHQPGVPLRVAVSRLDHRCRQSRRALRPFREAATCRRPDAGHASRRPAGPRLSGGSADLSQGSAPVRRRDRRLHDGRLGRARGRGVARPARA